MTRIRVAVAALNQTPLDWSGNQARIVQAIREDCYGHSAGLPARDDVTLVAYGSMVRDARHAADALATEGVSVEVIDLRSLVPLDVETLIGSGNNTGRAVVIHEGHRTAGYGAELAARIQEEALYSLLAPVQRVTGWDTIFPLKRTEEYYLPGVDRISQAARRTLEG